MKINKDLAIAASAVLVCTILAPVMGIVGVIISVCVLIAGDLIINE